MRIDATRPQAPQAPQAGQAALERRLRRACRDLEAVFLRHLLEKMRQTLPKGGLLGQSRGEELFRSMLDDALADEMAKSGSLGLGQVLYDQLSRSILKHNDHLKPDGSSAEDVSG